MGGSGLQPAFALGTPNGGSVPRLVEGKWGRGNRDAEAAEEPEMQSPLQQP